MAFAAILHFRLGPTQPAFLLYAMLTIPLTILITWVYHGSGDSLLLVMLFHAAVNTWSGPLMISPEAAGSTRPFVSVVILTWTMALLIIVGFRGVRTQMAGE